MNREKRFRLGGGSVQPEFELPGGRERLSAPGIAEKRNASVMGYRDRGQTV